MGMFIGLFLLLFALQVYIDVQDLSKGAEGSNLLVLNKKFERHFGKPLHFSEEDLDSLKQQSFLGEVAPLESSRFQVEALSRKLRFRTLLFFQSVPTTFVDVDSSLFKWKKGAVLPIVLPKDYLALYNFGFAASQGLPKFSASTIGLVDFTIRLRGNGRSEEIPAYICGFSSTISTILVPESFMGYANSRYGSAPKPCSQVLVYADNPYHTGLNQFFDRKGYELSKGGLMGGELKSALFLLVSLLVAISSVIIVLSMLVFLLNFQLVVANAKQDITLLLQLGYEVPTIAKQLSVRLFSIFGIVLLADVFMLFIAKYILSVEVNEQGYDLAYLPAYPVAITGLLFAALFVSINLRSVQQHVKRLV